MKTKNTPLDLIYVKNDYCGSPRCVCHFLSFITEGDKIKAEARANKNNTFVISEEYNIAIQKAKTVGGEKIHNEQYGGGILFTCYKEEMQEKINEVCNININFKEEWSKADFKKVDKTIYNYFKNHLHEYGKNEEMRKLIPYSFNDIDMILGLAYTSTSSFALYGICNTSLKANNKYSFEYFAVNELDEIIAICQDKEENYIYIKL